MQTLLIVGATSAIAEAVARRCAARGMSLFLVARDPVRLAAIGADLSVRDARHVHSHAMDINDLAAHTDMLDHAWQALGRVDAVLVAHGTLPDQQACEAAVDTFMAEFATNGTSTMALLGPLANRLVAAGSGTLAVISSVAGDRGRQSNYAYGAAKAAVSAYLSGLRQRLAKGGVAVVDIRPGFVDTPMTAHLRKGPLWATPDQVARRILGGMGRGTPVLYAPGFWRLIMCVVRAVPQSIFNRISM
ncbi:MAG: Decaprenylphosphoryl-2-keto-beta-D-erythro-pentose reductase [Stenotrophomonas maltophilia]|uniref:Decaprenylphosphoryl-2-keto-beta-D-erythro-pentose reductase n=1 Tax=Stenotrophomonas maltophilia TaxID=40324 RepID=A0A7V8JKZ9_STEMA|nr:MAG: Decaprenylphosphoryl-2-keto-beta-D-erythro-pentose reductase [Stenotrophomonas maltophilia]